MNTDYQVYYPKIREERLKDKLDCRGEKHFNCGKVTELLNTKNEQIDFTDLKKGAVLEIIAQLKYIVFSKDTSFVTWEVTCAKLHKRVNRVPKFGFIEDPEDCSQIVESEDEEIEVHTFF